MMYDEYIDRVTEVVTGIVQQAGDRNNVLIDLGKVEALLPRSEQVDGERYEQGSRIKAVITEVRSGHEGPAGDPVAARPGADPHVVRARGAGDRRRARRDPRGCARARLPVEDRGRVARPGRRPGRRLRGPPRLARAHGRVGAARREDRHHPVEHRAGAFCRQGAVARARPRGLHRRRHQGGHRHRPRRPAGARDRQGGLERPSRRTPPGWKVDIKSDTEFAQEEAEAAFAGEDDGNSIGRCTAILSTGKRCPNSALPGSRFCGVPAHQELAEREARGEDISDQVVQPAAEADDEPELDEEARRRARPTARQPAELRSRR